MRRRRPWRSDAVAAAFVAESPINRANVATFVADAASALPRGARVLDAGAGDAPYRGLFAHTRYTTSDWAGSMHRGALTSDIVAPLDALPVEDDAFDAIVCTEVLEHVADPQAVVRELRRVLVPGGRAWFTTPFVWQEHEAPHDYYRYTRFALESLLSGAGWNDVEVTPFGGWFSVAGQLVRNFGSITGHDQRRGLGTRVALRGAAGAGRAIARLDRFDPGRGLPIGFGTTARNPAGEA